MPELIRQFGLDARTFASAESFLASEFVNDTSCLLLDIAMPGMSGTDLWQELIGRGQMIPIVFITASGDKSIRRRVIAEGAVECLFKPFSGTALRECRRLGYADLDALYAAVDRADIALDDLLCSLGGV